MKPHKYKTDAQFLYKSAARFSRLNKKHLPVNRQIKHNTDVASAFSLRAENVKWARGFDAWNFGRKLSLPCGSDGQIYLTINEHSMRGDGRVVASFEIEKTTDLLGDGNTFLAALPAGEYNVKNCGFGFFSVWKK